MYPVRLSSRMLALIVSLMLPSFASAMYDPGLGRFCSRDPIGFRSGTSNQYDYAKASPAVLFDPTGWCAVKKRTPDECCDEAWKLPRLNIKKGTWGILICCEGEMMTCARTFKSDGSDKDGIDILLECTTEHENVHVPDMIPCNPNEPRITRPNTKPVLGEPITTSRDRSECKADERELNCLLDLIDGPKGCITQECKDMVMHRIRVARGRMFARNCKNRFQIEIPDRPEYPLPEIFK